jgi:hypothetical protein
MGPDYVASQGWKASDPGIVYLVGWHDVVKVGIGIDQRRVDLWVKYDAELYAMYDVLTRENALYVERSMKNFMARIGKPAFETAAVAPRYLTEHAGWTECWRVDEVHRDAVRGEFDRLTARHTALTSQNAEKLRNPAEHGMIYE